MAPVASITVHDVDILIAKIVHVGASQLWRDALSALYRKGRLPLTLRVKLLREGLSSYQTLHAQLSKLQHAVRMEIMGEIALQMRARPYTCSQITIIASLKIDGACFGHTCIFWTYNPIHNTTQFARISLPCIDHGLPNNGDRWR